GTHRAWRGVPGCPEQTVLGLVGDFRGQRRQPVRPRTAVTSRPRIRALALSGQASPWRSTHTRMAGGAAGAPSDDYSSGPEEVVFRRADLHDPGVDRGSVLPGVDERIRFHRRLPVVRCAHAPVDIGNVGFPARARLGEDLRADEDETVRLVL